MAKTSKVEDEYCETSNPKIVYFDIETTLGLYWGFDTGKQYVDWKRIKKEPVICCICWAVNDGKVQSAKFDLSKYDLDSYDDESDKEMLSNFYDVVADATLLIGHNAKYYDIAFMLTRMMKHKLPPLPPPLVDDTYLMLKLAKSQSYSLDYWLRFFGIGKKKDHEGLEMWKKVSYRDKKALSEMISYCVDDVLGLRKLYKYVKPYLKSSLNLSAFNGITTICPSCASSNVQRRGFDFTTVGKYQRYQCMECGAWFKDGKNLIKKAKNFHRQK